jgi:hypothetical protein
MAQAAVKNCPAPSEVALHSSEASLRARIISLTYEIMYLLKARETWVSEHNKVLAQREELVAEHSKIIAQLEESSK